MNRLHFGLALGLMFVAASLAQASNCPFCSAVSQTFSEEMASMDVAVFARLTQSAETPDKVPDPNDVVRAQFEIVSVLKGGDFVVTGDTFETVYFGDAGKDDLFLVQGIQPPAINWTTPLRLTKRSQAYLKQLDQLPAGGAERLVFFQNHLEDSEEMLARDAYDEFAKAPYDDIKELKDKMDHDQLMQWLKNPDIPASRKRLYFTMLGVCGSKHDLPMLEELMKSEDRREKAGLDAMIACYLTLSGPEGMGLIEEVFLKNKEADYSDTYAAIAALRFHGTEADLIPQERIVEGLGYMLDRPELADLVIPDLARWEDWSVMDRLVTLFKTADEKTSWVRVPVINYLRACPLPEAKAHLAELEKIDPDAVRRASTFFPVLDDEEEEEEGGDDKGTEAEKSVDKDKATDAGDDEAQAPGNVEQASYKQENRAVERLALIPSVALASSLLTAAPADSDAAHSNRSPAADVSDDTAEIPAARFVSTPPNARPLADAQTPIEVADSQAAPTGPAILGQSPATSALILVVAMMLFCVGVFAVQWSILTGRVVRLFN